MTTWEHLQTGYVPVPVMTAAAFTGLVFTAGAVTLLQGVSQLTFAQLMALGAVLGGMPTAVTLWVIRVLYDLRAKVAKLEGLPERMKNLEERLDGHVNSTPKET